MKYGGCPPFFIIVIIMIVIIIIIIIIIIIMWQNKRLDAQSKNEKTLAGRQTVTSRSID